MKTEEWNDRDATAVCHKMVKKERLIVLPISSFRFRCECFEGPVTHEKLKHAAVGVLGSIDLEGSAINNA